MTSIKAYIILVNYNGSLDTIECLESVLKSSYKNYQILVVDNSETDESISVFQDWSSGKILSIETCFEHLVYPLEAKPIDALFTSTYNLYSKKHDDKIIFVKSNKNRGFAAANNILLKYVFNHGEEDSYIWLLNNDTVVEKDALANIVSKVKKDQDFNHKAIYGTPLIEYKEPNQIQAIGGIYNKNTGLTFHFGENNSKYDCKYDFESDNIVDYPVGASMIIHKQFLTKIGLMCEDYFLYFEELDWTQRAKNKGGWLKILDVFGIYHKQGFSTKAKSNLKKTEFIDLTFLKSRIHFAKKFNNKNLTRVYLSIMTLTIARRIFQGNFRRIPKIIKIVFKKTL